MTFTIFSLVMSIILFSLVGVICYLLLCQTRINWLWLIVFVLVLSILRCLFPIEIKDVYVINCWKVYPAFFEFLQYKLFDEIRIKHIIFVVWFIGFIIVLVKQTREIFKQIHLNCMTNILLVDTKVNNIAKKVEKELACKKRVEVYVVKNSIVPIMVGFNKPIILISDETLNLKDNEIEYILRHEVCHFKGGDIWIRLLFQFIVCILWWNPVVYLIRHSIIQVLELRCDNRACRSLTDDKKMEYIAVLIKSIKINLNKKRTSLAAGFVGNYYKSFIKQRIKMLLTPISVKPPLWKIILSITICIFLFVGSYAVVFQPAFAPKTPSGVHEVTLENAWIVHTIDGEYEIWVEGSYLNTLSVEALQTEPFNQLQIYEEEDLP